VESLTSGSAMGVRFRFSASATIVARMYFQHSRQSRAIANTVTLSEITSRLPAQ